VDKVMNLNVRSIFLMSQAIGKHSMIPRRAGKIINVASIAGLAGNSADMAMVAYNTSKAAVVNFTRTLAGEWGKYNINVNALAPGMFPSKMTKGTIARIGEKELASHAPLLRIGDDDDLKGATLLFASQAGKHITGQVLPIDGGVSAIIGA
jgi:gluconate 5-dehydrogenase